MWEGLAIIRAFPANPMAKPAWLASLLRPGILAIRGAGYPPLGRRRAKVERDQVPLGRVGEVDGPALGDHLEPAVVSNDDQHPGPVFDPVGGYGVHVAAAHVHAALGNGEDRVAEPVPLREATVGA